MLTIEPGAREIYFMKPFCCFHYDWKIFLKLHPEPLSFLKDSTKATIMGTCYQVVYDENS
jgi:hypothetical protein